MNAATKILSTAIAIPLLVSSFTALAGGHKSSEGHKKHHHYHGMTYLLKDVDLTDEQKAKIKEIKQAKHKAYKENREERKNAAKEMHQNINKLILAESFDEQAVRALAAKSVEKQIENRVEKLRTQHQIMSLLTPEQKQQVQQNMNDMGKKHKKKDKED